MGWTYEVSVWHMDGKGDYRYYHEYAGESLLKALWIMWKLKRAGTHCIKLEWR